MALSVVSFN